MRLGGKMHALAHASHYYLKIMRKMRCVAGAANAGFEMDGWIDRLLLGLDWFVLVKEKSYQV